ncbi:hypothetical protein OM075_24990 [Marinilabiliaceae bacterium AAT]|uniref:Uncharacterized protein n=2 Tax=Plebeiibacterium sediminum TaxID=2992112 RepID=A0AAE3MAG2_9BACT|nr:hypothetical protein [Plebeiobacterium sediminum]
MEESVPLIGSDILLIILKYVVIGGAFCLMDNLNSLIETHFLLMGGSVPLIGSNILLIILKYVAIGGVFYLMDYLN